MGKTNQTKKGNEKQNNYYDQAHEIIYNKNMSNSEILKLRKDACEKIISKIDFDRILQIVNEIGKGKGESELPFKTWETAKDWLISIINFYVGCKAYPMEGCGMPGQLRALGESSLELFKYTVDLEMILKDGFEAKKREDVDAKAKILKNASEKFGEDNDHVRIVKGELQAINELSYNEEIRKVRRGILNILEITDRLLIDYPKGRKKDIDRLNFCVGIIQWWQRWTGQKGGYIEAYNSGKKTRFGQFWEILTGKMLKPSSPPSEKMLKRIVKKRTQNQQH